VEVGRKGVGEMTTERNLFIDAYRRAGREFLASRLALVMGTDAEVAAHSHPAVRDHYAQELRTMLGDDGYRRLCLEMAERAMELMVPDKEGDKNGN